MFLINLLSRKFKIFDIFSKEINNRTLINFKMPANSRKRRKNETEILDESKTEAELAEKTPLTKELVDICLKNMRFNFELKEKKPLVNTTNKKKNVNEKVNNSANTISSSRPTRKNCEIKESNDAKSEPVSKAKIKSESSEPTKPSPPRSKRRHVKLEYDKEESEKTVRIVFIY